MTGALERTWVGCRDSAAVRRLEGSTVGRELLRSQAFRMADTRRRWAETAIRSRRDPERFATVRTFVTFLGTVKSGGTLVGSLLDAHPHVIVSDEADPIRYVGAGFRRDQIFHLLEKTSRREAMKGRVTARRLDPYSLAVPGHWQGRSEAVSVIGDSRAGPTTRRLGEQLGLIDDLRLVLGPVEDRYIHVVRSPYDPISAMVIRGRRTLSGAVADYAGQCRRLAALRGRIEPERLMTVRYETLVAAPRVQLGRICRFLGVEADADYLSACAGIVDPGRPGERQAIAWTPEARAAVGRLLEENPFLAGYAGVSGPASDAVPHAEVGTGGRP